MPAPNPPHEVELTHRTRFSAAHRLWSEALGEDENRAAYGPCVGDHGHDFELEVAVRGPVDPRTGMLINLIDLIDLVRTRVFEPCDHKHLNHDVPFLAGRVTTVENVALAIWGELADGLAEIETPHGAEARLARLRLWEGPECSVTLTAD
ncbi:MAG: 6-carboxytetrahydropterin synthase [Planctomycetota bacterium]